jgi:hypothetical protein
MENAKPAWNQNRKPFRWTNSAADIKRSLANVSAICEELR